MNETNASCRIPLLLMFLSAAVWLVLSSAFALIASLKFHSPNFLADCSWLTYGRVRPAGLDSMLYGFCVEGGLAPSRSLLIVVVLLGGPGSGRRTRVVTID